jgi:hypothetical protein
MGEEWTLEKVNVARGQLFAHKKSPPVVSVIVLRNLIGIHRTETGMKKFERSGMNAISVRKPFKKSAPATERMLLFFPVVAS